MNANAAEEWQRLNLRAQFGGSLPFTGLPTQIGLPGHVGPFSIFSAGVSFNGPILDLTLFRRYQAARSAADAAKFDSQSTREQVILLVVSQYIGTLRSVADGFRPRNRALILAQALFNQAADLQKAGRQEPALTRCAPMSSCKTKNSV